MVPPKWGYSSAAKGVADVPGRRTPRSCAGSAASGRTAGPIALARARLFPRLKALAVQAFAVAILGGLAPSHNRPYDKCALLPSPQQRTRASREHGSLVSLCAMSVRGKVSVPQ